MLLFDAIKEYLIYIEKEMSISSFINYKKSMSNFFQWHKNYYLQDLRQAHLDNYIKKLKERGYKNNTINIHIASLKSFFNFYKKNGIELKFTLKSLPKPNPQGQLLSSFDYLGIIDNIYHDAMLSEEGNSPIIFLRNLLIVQLLIETGISTSELTKIQLSDINLQRKKLQIHESERPVRCLDLKQSTINLIYEYLETIKLSRGFLFFRLDRGWDFSNIKISSRSIERMVLKVSENKFRPKDFRYTYIINQLKIHKAIYVVSDNVGGLSDDTKTYLRKIMTTKGFAIKIHNKDYDAYEYLRNKYGKVKLWSMLSKKEIKFKFSDNFLN